MSRKKTLLLILLVLVVLSSAVLGVIWNLRHYVLVDFQFYPKDARQLDLRDQEIGIRSYEKLLRRMPECEILWKVPFQGTTLPWDVEEITVSALTQQDIRTLAYFEQLEKVKAKDCQDYEGLLKLYKQRPDLQVEYTVSLGGENYAPAAERVVLKTVTP